MILEEMVEDRIRHYSNTNMHIRQIETGVLYEDAVDVLPLRYTYEETDIPIEDYDISAEEALHIITGGAT